jgi:hypothetical protein
MSGHGRAITAFAVATLFVGTTASVTAQCDPLKLVDLDGPHAGSEFGAAVDLTGDLAVIGAPGWDADRGRVVLAEWNGSVWKATAALATPAAVGPGDRFGSAVAINDLGNVIIASAPYHGPSGEGLVAVYEPGPGPGGWTHTEQWTGSAPWLGQLGRSVDAAGDYVVIGEPGGGGGKGAVTIMRRAAPGSWVLDDKLAGSEAGGIFGFSVSLYKTRLAVGAPWQDVGTHVDNGVVTIYQRSGSSWALIQTLDWTPSGANTIQGQGWSVAIAKDHLLVGVPVYEIIGYQSGATYHYWEAGQYHRGITSLFSDPDPVEGIAVAASWGGGALGGPGQAGLVHPGAGRVEMFYNPAANRYNVHLGMKESPEAEPDAHFGASLAADGVRILAGEPLADEGGAIDAGRVWTHELTDPITVAVLDGGLAGEGGVEPGLAGSGTPCQYRLLWLYVDDALPFADAWMVVGLSELWAPFKGGVMAPDADLIVPFSISSVGYRSLTGQIPAGLPPLTIWAQAWIDDPAGPVGFAATNAVRAEMPTF